MKQEDFNEQMGDIMSSGPGWWYEFHDEAVRKLFDTIDRDELKTLLTNYYNNEVEPGEFLEDELEHVSKISSFVIQVEITVEDQE